MQRDQLFGTYLEQVKNLYGPWQKVNCAMLNNMEKAIQFQLEAVQRYSHMGTERLKAANEIREIDDLQNYASRQAELFSEWSSQVMDDARTLTELGMEFRNDLGQAFSEAGGQTARQIDDLSRQVNETSQQVLETVHSVTDITAEATQESSSETAKAAADTSKSSAGRSSSSSSSRSSKSNSNSSNSNSGNSSKSRAS